MIYRSLKVNISLLLFLIGNLYIAYSNNSIVFNQILRELPGETAQFSFQDSKGNIWFGFESAGLFKYDVQN